MELLDAILAQVAAQAQLLGTWMAAILTLMVYTRLIGDNALARLADHLFVGTAAGYALVVAVESVIMPKMVLPLVTDPVAHASLVVPLLLGLLLLLRPVPVVRPWTAIPLALVIGVGAGLTVGGALVGTIVPQVAASMLPIRLADDPLGGINAVMLLIGVLSTILYFSFTIRTDRQPGRVVSWAGVLGKWVMFLTFGALFASALTGRLALVVGRMQFLLHDWLGFLP